LTTVAKSLPEGGRHRILGAVKGTAGAGTMRAAAIGIIAGLTMAAGTEAAPETVVATGAGAVAGTVRDGVAAWLGIPYAAPPVGERRWRAPQPVAPWDGARPATGFGPDCLQVPVESDAAPVGTEPAEDCLYLNVWRPAAETGAEAEAPLPVLVWIHGGGYVNGGASPAVYDGAALARQGLVVVSFNYRLGRFGFFAHPALAAEGESGNFALLDMLAALGWVRENVAAFGGDPGAVTVMGESAGGDAVAHLMTMPAAGGLIQRAAILSGNGWGHLLGGLDAEAAAAVGLAWAAREGVAGTDAAALAALRALPAGRVLGGISMESMLTRPDLGTVFAMGPIVDGSLVRAAPGAVLAEGLHPAVPVLIGTTRDDLPLHLPPLGDPLGHFGADRTAAQAVYAADGITERGPLVLAIGADRTMQAPARRVATALARRGVPSWLYRFDHVAEAMRGEWTRGAPHASELPYVFGTLEARYPGAVAAADRAAAAEMQALIVGFARDGRPRAADGTAWPAWDPDDGRLILIGPEGAALVADPLRARLDAVDRAEETSR
jgi:para-nitrobenzyl esterase